MKASRTYLLVVLASALALVTVASCGEQHEPVGLDQATNIDEFEVKATCSLRFSETDYFYDAAKTQYAGNKSTFCTGSVYCSGTCSTPYKTVLYSQKCPCPDLCETCVTDYNCPPGVSCINGCCQGI